MRTAPASYRPRIESQLALLVAALLFAGFVEYPHYQAQGGWDESKLSQLGHAAVVWLLAAKSLVPLMPVFALAVVIGRLGRVDASRRLMLTGVVVGALWLVLDLWLQRNYGAHLASYLPFIVSALAAFGSADHTQWVGNPRALALAGLSVLAATIGIGLAFHLTSRWLGARLLGGAGAVTTSRLSRAASAILFLLIAGGYLAQSLINPPQLRKRIAMSVPLSSEWFGQGLLADESSRDVHLLGLVPSSWSGHRTSEILIYNPRSRPVDLDGWSVQNARGTSAALQGEIGPVSERRFTFSEGSFPISERAAEVRLLDAGSELLSRIGYRNQNVARGSVYWNPAVRPMAHLLDRISFDGSLTYGSLFDRIQVARTPELRVAEPRSPAPNVILLVVESLHYDALSPDIMGGLYSWVAERGILGQHHYAATNTSHKGLFSLLYSRLPLSYEAVLDAGKPVPASALFRQLGYATHFVSSGGIEAWKRMDEFLNRRTFDEMHLNLSTRRPAWRQWPDNDRRTLETILELAAEPGPKFIFGFLMTTHFPYPFPPEFRIFEPVSHEGELETWNQLFRADLDRTGLWNRYRNAARYLDSKLLEFVQSLDPERNVLLITGDHGESFGEDGTLIHGSRASDVQNRAPLAILGPGVEPRLLRGFTSHLDVLPTLLHLATDTDHPVRGLEGWDLLADGEPRHQILVNPYKPTQPEELLLIRNDQRLLLNVRADRPELEAVAFVDESGFPDLEARVESMASAEEWSAALRSELERLAGVRTSPER